MPALKTDYLDPEWEGNKIYIMTTYPDSSVSFTDVTPYIQAGDYIKAQDINTTNDAVNDFADLYKSWIGGSFTPLKDDYIDAEWDGKKKFSKTDNLDGTVSLQDITVYTVNGDTYNANAINTTNTLINSFTNAYDDGIEDIADRLQALGVSDTSDLLAAIDTMAAVQYSDGVALGKRDVTTSPNTYGLYTPAQYNSQKSTNDNLLAGIRSVSSQLTPYSTSGNWTSDIPAKSYYTNCTSNIQKDMSSQIAATIKGQVKDFAQILATEISTHLTAGNNAYNSFITTLRGLL